MLATITKVILLIRLMNLFSGLRCKFKLCLNDSVLNETLDISRSKSDTMCRMIKWGQNFPTGSNPIVTELSGKPKFGLGFGDFVVFLK